MTGTATAWLKLCRLLTVIMNEIGEIWRRFTKSGEDFVLSEGFGTERVLKPEKFEEGLRSPAKIWGKNLKLKQLRDVFKLG